MADYSQTQQQGELFTPLGDNALVLHDFSGAEHVNGINEFRVTAESPSGRLDLSKLIGAPMRIDVQSSATNTRVFHQICYGATTQSSTEISVIYEFELRPWLWAMNLRTNSRIFHDMTVIEIVTQVCAEYGGLGGNNVEDKTNGGFPALEFVVQFCETDLQFIRRLLEENGINFHISMQKDSHSLVLTSSPDAFATTQGAPQHNPGGNRGLELAESIVKWSDQQNFTTASIKLMDYNFVNPTQNMAVEQTKENSTPLQAEYYEYPGRYDNPEQGRKLGQRRLDALKCRESLIDATGTAPCLGAGMKFTMTSQYDPSLNGEYAVLRADHRLQNGDYRSGKQTKGGYSGSYVLTRSSNPVAPMLTTQRPRMMGPQTAIVCDGGDGNVDEYGRIIVKFHWDSNAKSMPCRVSQTWAGPKWGAVFIPHTGMEVIVDFIGGDPDRPIILGCVYNGDNMPPWPLPDKKTISGVKTVTDNEISFDDLAGNELINIDAKKNFTVHVTENHTIEVDQKRVIKVHDTETTTVDGSLTLESKQEIILKVGSSKITMNAMSITIEAKQIEVKASLALKTNGGINADHKAGGVMTIEAPMVKIN